MRPTSERARQAYFNIIGDRITGARFLDLISGSGIFSFEAVSRGAASSTAIDRDKRNTTTIAKLAATFDAAVNVVTGDVLTLLPRMKEPFDLVYADPPYDFEDYSELIEGIAALPLAPDAIVAVEHRRGSNPFENREPRTANRELTITRHAEYGEVWITFFATAEAAATGLAIREE